MIYSGLVIAIGRTKNRTALNLVLGEEEERQTHDTIKLHEGSYHDKAGCRNIFLYAIERCDDDAEERTIVVRIEKLQRILGIQ